MPQTALPAGTMPHRLRVAYGLAQQFHYLGEQTGGSPPDLVTRANAFEDDIWFNVLQQVKYVADNMGASLLPSGSLKFTKLTGQDGDPATYTLTGAAAGDEIWAVIHLSTAAAIATSVDVTADFEITDDDELTDNEGTDYTNDELWVFWVDRTPA